MIAIFAAAGGSAWLGAGLAVGWLERASTDEVSLQMGIAGHDWAAVEGDGLQVVLSGEAPSEALRFEALSVAGTVVDAARVIDSMDVVDTQNLVAPSFSVEMLRTAAGVSLIGLIPAAIDRADVLRRVERAADGTPVTDLLETADHPMPEGFEDAMDYALRALATLARSQISVSEAGVDLRATAESGPERRRLLAELDRRRPEGLDAVVEISAPRPVIAPFALRFVKEPSGRARFETCAADTEAARDAIRAAAAAAGFGGIDDGCRLGLGTPTPAWGDAAAAGIAAVEALGAGSITLSDTDATLIAVEGTDPDLFTEAAGALDAALPEVFALTTVLPEPEVEGEAAAPAFVATLSPEGRFQARGDLVDPLAVAAVETYAQARFGADETFLATETREDLPTGWTLRVLAGLEALSEVQRGAVEVSPEAVAVRGETGNPDATARIAQSLSEALGEGAPFSIEVAYSEALDPAANIPTPEECLARITVIKDARKINFEPGSATLDGDSRETISMIAEVLRECADPQIEVAGHTDSQGREEMNLNLSQLRAEAVIEALRAERIVAEGLVAVGYGEAAPIADNGTEEGREANRRIEFTMRGGEAAAEAGAEAEGEDGSDGGTDAEGAAADAEASDEESDE
ncbi:MAG: OmpA family protein [Shimia sp.]